MSTARAPIIAIFLPFVLGAGACFDPSAPTGTSEGSADDDEDDDDATPPRPHDSGTTTGVDIDRESSSSSSSSSGDASTTTAVVPGTSSSNDTGEATTVAESTSSSSGTGENPCGDGEVEPGEQCDGDDLQGFDCASLGLSGGTLACDPITCSFDTSMCRVNGGTGTTG